MPPQDANPTPSFGGFGLRHNEGGLPVVLQAVPNYLNGALSDGLVVGFLLVWKPDFQGDVGVAPGKGLHQRHRAAEHLVVGYPYPALTIRAAMAF